MFIPLYNFGYCYDCHRQPSDLMYMYSRQVKSRFAENFLFWILLPTWSDEPVLALQTWCWAISFMHWFAIDSKIAFGARLATWPLEPMLTLLMSNKACTQGTRRKMKLSSILAWSLDLFQNFLCHYLCMPAWLKLKDVYTKGRLWWINSPSERFNF